MYFRILGTVELANTRAALPPKIRLLLVNFLVHANKVISTERIIDEIWGDEPPRTVVTTLQVYVSQLRKVLPPLPDGSGRVTTRAPGYLFHLLPGESDVAVFEQQHTRARRAFRTGDFALAERLLDEALAVWRGPAAADVLPGPILSGVVVALEEARLAALELRVECGLRLDRHPELVPQLQLLTVEHPFRERLVGQLMVALAESGRLRDALFAYDGLRARLAEDLASIPSSWLIDLRRRILTAQSGRAQAGPAYGGPAYGGPAYGGPAYGGPAYGSAVHGSPIAEA